MKKFMLGILAVVIFVAFMPLNAQVMPDKKIEPVEEPKDDAKPDPKVKPDAKKYDLKIVYTKDMVFERTTKMKMKIAMEPDMGFSGDMTMELKLKNTVLNVKDGVPTELKCEIVDAKQTGEMPMMGMMPEGETDDIKKLKGHWLKVKQNKEGKFEITEKSEKFPETETLKDSFGTNSTYFDEMIFPKKAIAVGETFKIDLTKNMGGNEKQFENAPADLKLNEFKIKFDKVVEKDGVTLGYFSGNLEQEITEQGQTAKIVIKTNLVHDITNNRSLKMDATIAIEAAQPEMTMTITIGVTMSNNYGKIGPKEEKKPEITPKDDE